MAIIKCPRCDINFIREEEQFCQICKREMRGEAKREELLEMCIECGENPALPGEDLCSACLLDKKLAEEVAGQDAKDDDAPGAVIDSAEIDMNTIDVATESDDIPETELEVIHKELSLDELEEEEKSDDEDKEEKDDDDLGF